MRISAPAGMSRQATKCRSPAADPSSTDALVPRDPLGGSLAKHSDTSEGSGQNKPGVG
eukprot:XP_001690511.1 predicted protein [Chlamydomonas reinhardtii]